VSEVSDHSEELDGLPVFWRDAPAPERAGNAPALYLHGVPNNSDDWLPCLERTGGLAPDLPGFGRSGKPGSLRYTIEEYEGFLERFLKERELERVSLVMHDWGAVGLAFAQRHPERIERIVIINAVPFLPGYRWHRIARVWRTPGLGELAMGMGNRRTLGFLSRETNATPGPMPQEWLRSVLDHFDQGTQRAILRLYRSSPPEVLERAGAQLGLLDMPALVVWGMSDPYLPGRFAADYAAALPNAELLEIAGAGHVPWLDRPEVADRVVGFLNAASR
jgi:pimeloyl-ACP methyl ester carboxylesterase